MPEEPVQIPLLAVMALTCPGLATPVTLSVHGGECWLLLTPKPETSSELVRLLLGIDRGEAGQVTLFGQTLAGRPDHELRCLRRRIGVVSATKGLVSNLKALENVLLPAQYFNLPLTAPPHEAALTVLQRTGYRGDPMALPYRLTRYQRRQVTLARALLIDPELMIYDSLGDGIAAGERTTLLELAMAFHAERSGRATLFLTSDESMPSRLPGARVSNLSTGARA